MKLRVMLLSGLLGLMCAATADAERGGGRGFGDEEMGERGGRKWKSARAAAGPKMSEKQSRKVMKFLKKNVPEVHEKIVEIREENPRVARKLLGKFARAYRHFKKSKDPARKKAMIMQMRAQFRIRELVEKYKESEDEKEKKTLRPQIKDGLEKIFDAKLANQEAQLGKMKKRLARMEDRIVKRRKAKKDLIDRRLKVMTGEAATFDW